MTIQRDPDGTVHVDLTPQDAATCVLEALFWRLGVTSPGAAVVSFLGAGGELASLAGAHVVLKLRPTTPTN